MWQWRMTINGESVSVSVRDITWEEEKDNDDVKLTDICFHVDSENWKVK
jgi:hypothetical protein